MINKIKTGIMLCRYGFSFKSNVAGALIFMVLGIVMQINMINGMSFLGSMYIVLSAVFMYQLICSVTISTMIQTSGYKKQLQTLIPTITSVPFMMLMYTVCVIMYYFMKSGSEEYAIRNLLLTAIFVFFMEIYTGTAYKYFVVSMGVMLVSIYAFMFNSDRIMEKLMTVLSSLSLNSFGAVIVIGYVAIIVGGVLEYLLSCLFYKKPLSKMAFGAALKRAAQ